MHPGKHSADPAADVFAYLAAVFDRAGEVDPSVDPGQPGLSRGLREAAESAGHAWQRRAGGFEAMAVAEMADQHLRRRGRHDRGRRRILGNRWDEEGRGKDFGWRPE